MIKETIIHKGKTYNFTATSSNGHGITEERRQLASRYLRQEFECGINPKIFGEFVKEMKALIYSDAKKNEEKLELLSNYIFALETRRTYSINRSSLLWLASIYFHVEIIDNQTNEVTNEPEMDIEGKFDSIKYEAMINGTPEQIVFFCKKAYQFTELLTPILSDNFQSYLAQVDDILNSVPIPTL
jgi:hypothetical protein